MIRGHVVSFKSTDITICIKKLVSSAEDEFSRLDMLHISLIYRINSLGPNVEPFGMPHEIVRISGLRLYIVCTYIQAKLSVIILIILEARASIYDERFLSEGFMSGRSLCPDGVINGGVLSKGILSEGFLSKGVLSG